MPPLPTHLVQFLHQTEGAIYVTTVEGTEHGGGDGRVQQEEDDDNGGGRAIANSPSVASYFEPPEEQREKGHHDGHYRIGQQVNIESTNLVDG